MSVLSDKLNLIWYGDYEVHQTNKCVALKLSDHSQIKRVYRVDGNLWPTYRKGAASNSFDTLECGYGYIIELEDNTSVDIPHANFSPNGNVPRGMFVAEVDISSPTPSPSPTPTPTQVQGCIPSSHTTISYPTTTEKSVLVENLGNVTFMDEGDFGFLPSDFSVTSPPKSLFVNDGEFSVVVISLTNIPSEGSEPQVYFECKSAFCNGKCYGGKVTTKANGDYEVNLELISSVATPTPSPTPTPVAPLECGRPNDPAFGDFDLLEISKIAAGEHGHKIGNGVQGANTHIYTDIALDLKEKHNVELDVSLLKFQPGAIFGDMRGTLTYQRNYDPSGDNVINWTGIGAKLTYCYFEGDDLPTQLSEMTAKARFAVQKGIQCTVADLCTDNTIFLQVDEKCYTGELMSDADHDKFAFTEGISNFGTSLFLVILKEV